MAKIRELGEMRSQGLLTDEEFAAEKGEDPGHVGGIYVADGREMVGPRCCK